MDGLLLFAHGARDAEWARPFEEVKRRIALAHPELPLALAFLEFMQPELEAAAHGLVARGCRRIHIVPMFLGTGGHVRRDIPPLLDRLQLEHGPQVEWQLHAALGEQETVIQAMTASSLAWLKPAADSPA